MYLLGNVTTEKSENNFCFRTKAFSNSAKDTEQNTINRMVRLFPKTILIRLKCRTHGTVEFCQDARERERPLALALIASARTSLRLRRPLRQSGPPLERFAAHSVRSVRSVRFVRSAHFTILCAF